MTMTMRGENRANVLLVEDEPLICEMVTEALTEQGFDVEAVSNAGDALHHLKSGAAVDILFTDINLPGDMDGDMLAQRAREIMPNLPVMYTSGRRWVSERSGGLTGSMFLPKPYNPYDVGRLLESLVSGSEAARR